ncbi:glycosyltransferase family 2 protein [Maribacter sp. 2-571]|uniref:glycosyltransferase family 2 protein n=1 Tax=Maribacter sp. 2-571 TaxID=3417569 RepID=UPI003D345CBA
MANKEELYQMNKTPLVSIITVVFNGEKYLLQTIDSVKEQTYPNLEYIIVDGGSTDRTLSIIKQNEDFISRWISEPDKGLYDAMNKGISMAKGEIVGMINSDDWYETNAVQLVVEEYRRNPEKKIFHGDRFDVLPNGSKRAKVFETSKFKFLYYGMTYNHPSMFVHADIYKTIKYNVSLRALSDYEFVLHNFLKHPEVFCYIEKCFVNYRLDGISGTMNFKNAILEGYLARKNAGFNVFRNLFSVALRTLRVVIGKLKIR